MKSKIPLSSIMKTNLVTISPNDTLEAVDELFTKNDFRHLPVIDETGKILGIISKSDYLALCHRLTLFRKEIERSKNLRLFRSLLVEEVMSRQLTTLSPDDEAYVAAGLFRENLFHAIPIVEEDKLVGLVTTIDLINYAYPQPDLVIG